MSYTCPVLSGVCNLSTIKYTIQLHVSPIRVYVRQNDLTFVLLFCLLSSVTIARFRPMRTAFQSCRRTFFLGGAVLAPGRALGSRVFFFLSRSTVFPLLFNLMANLSNVLVGLSEEVPVSPQLQRKMDQKFRYVPV